MSFKTPVLCDLLKVPWTCNSFLPTLKQRVQSALRVLTALEGVKTSQEDWGPYQGTTLLSEATAMRSSAELSISSIFLVILLILFSPSAPNIRVVGRVQLLIGGGEKAEIHSCAFFFSPQIRKARPRAPGHRGKSWSTCAITSLTKTFQMGRCGLWVLTGHAGAFRGSDPHRTWPSICYLRRQSCS